MSYGIIYCAYCTVTEKSYIGQTASKLRARWRFHKADAKKRTLPICKAIAEQGADAFELSVLAEADSSEQLNELEKLWISRRQSCNPQFGYNARFGGADGGKHTKESRANMSAAKTQEHPSPRALYMRGYRERKRLEAA